MKIKSDFSELWDSVRLMGDHSVNFELQAEYATGPEIDGELSSTVGRDVDLDDLDVDNGVLSVEGRQVLLFIPDHGSGIDDVIAGRQEGRKFHVADCQTLESMRLKKRFNRYKATYNTSGMFRIYGVTNPGGQHREEDVELHVCKHCLSYLNYKGYASAAYSEKSTVYGNFDIAEFLSAYSTLFGSMPSPRNFPEEGGYSDDWKVCSEKYRKSVDYRCEQCGVGLVDNPSLLHTHHISGNKRDNQFANLMALCLDCHRKQPKHEYMYISHQQMSIINRLRKDQGVINASGGWESVIALADQALDGLLRNYASKGVAPPEVGYELVGSDDQVIAELEVAWPVSKRAIAIDRESVQAAKELGWKVLTVGEALRTMNA